MRMGTLHVETLSCNRNEFRARRRGQGWGLRVREDGDFLTELFKNLGLEVLLEETLHGDDLATAHSLEDLSKITLQGK